MNRFARLALLAAALVASAVIAACVPAEDGGLLPGGLVLMAVAAQTLKRLTSPEKSRA